MKFNKFEINLNYNIPKLCIVVDDLVRMASKVTDTSFVVHDIIVVTRAFLVTAGRGRQDYPRTREVEDEERGGTASAAAR